MKRVVSLLLSFAMVFSLAACSNSAASERQDSVAAQNEEIQDTTKGTVEQSAVLQDAEQETAKPSEAPQGTKEQEKTQQDTISETENPESVSIGEQEAEMGTRTLVAYFSCTGTTQPLAEYAAEILGADLYEIVAEDPYTEADLAYYTGGRADQEQNDPSARPGIIGGVENMDEYDTIILGYPIWHGQAPRIINTFLESYDFSGKTILPFCTSHSSGIGSSADNLHTLCSDSTIWIDGKRFEAGTSKEVIEEWLRNEIIN